MNLDILNPQVELKLGGETLVVREMAWPKTVELISKLGLHAQLMFNSEGKLAIDLDKIVKAIQGTRELAEFLVRESTGKPDEWINTLAFSRFIAVLDTAISINISQEVTTNVKKLAGRLNSLGVPAVSMSKLEQS